MDEPGDQFPVGMRVLAVDDDPTCLFVLGALLRSCQYNGFLLLLISPSLFYFPFADSGFLYVLYHIYFEFQLVFSMMSLLIHLVYNIGPEKTCI